MSTFANFQQALGIKSAKVEKAIKISQAIANTAAGIARAQSDHPWPLSAVVSGIVAATGAAQVAQIVSSKDAAPEALPPLPAFATGGVLPAGKPSIVHSEELIMPAGEAGTRVFNKQETKDILQDTSGGGNMQIDITMHPKEFTNYFTIRQRKKGRTNT